MPKRCKGNMSQYQHVFVKTSKSHTEQVIDANFNIMLNEMTNEDAYYVSDNGRVSFNIAIGSALDFNFDIRTVVGSIPTTGEQLSLKI